MFAWIGDGLLRRVGLSRHDVKVAALAVAMVLAIQVFLPGAWPTPNVPDTSYRANPNTLQIHVEYFDRNHDGVISIPETYESVRLLGLEGPLNNIYRTAVIHLLYVKQFLVFSPPPVVLSPAFWKYLLSFDFQFRLPIATVHLLKHPSDSGAYDKDGQFVPERFDRLFDDFDKAGRGGINKCELDAFIESNNNPPNRAGNFGSKFEWGAAFDILHDSRGVVSREKLLKLYNGSVFEEVEREVAARKAGKRGGIRPVESTVLTKSA